MNASQVQRPRVLILGGGYAGLTVARALAGDFELVLVSPSATFLDTVKLHQSVHTPLARLQIPYASLLEPWHVSFHQASADMDTSRVLEWLDAGCLPLKDQCLTFDYLVLASGAQAKSIAQNTDCYTLDRLKTLDFSLRLQAFLDTTSPQERVLSVVGGGATGVQFLFELDDYLRRQRANCLIHFIHPGSSLLDAFPAKFSEYTLAKLRSRRGTIDHYPESYFLGQQNGRVRIQCPHRQRSLESAFSLVFAGLEPNPPLTTTAYGQVVMQGQVLERCFAAGDCASFRGDGMNSLSAQVAVQKARSVARNIRLSHSGRALQAYDYQERGYFVSLGPGDGIGWLLHPANILTGLAAFTVKQAIEAQFRWVLQR